MYSINILHVMSAKLANVVPLGLQREGKFLVKQFLETFPFFFFFLLLRIFGKLLEKKFENVQKLLESF